MLRGIRGCRRLLKDVGEWLEGWQWQRAGAADRITGMRKWLDMGQQHRVSQATGRYGY